MVVLSPVMFPVMTFMLVCILNLGTDRPDIISRIFKIKLDHLIHELKNDCLFGPIEAAGHKFPIVTDIDSVISVEIPDKEEDPELYELVKLFMMHGPCGADNPNCPCMVKNKCTKNFLKKFEDESSIDPEGYPIYRRRNIGNVVEKDGKQLDNRSVVPYNATLLRKYQCHMNVEWCNQTGFIKYLFKYINKGPDRVTASVYQTNIKDSATRPKKPEDEVKNYLDCRYVSACEAAWRIFAFDIHYRHPLVQWMATNARDKFARTLKYVDFPKHYVWLRDKRIWKRRDYSYTSIGRITYVPIALGDIYYLRILLNHIRGPKCFKDLKKVNGKDCKTYKEACQEMGLLDDDKKYVSAIQEASAWASESYLRNFLVMLLVSNSVTRPDFLWNQTKDLLSADILFNQRRLLNCPGLVLPEAELQLICLAEIEQLLLSNGSTLKNFPEMPYPSANYSLTSEQQQIYQTVIEAVAEKDGGVFFVYGYGGTGKTFLWKTITVALRSRGEIVLNVASSGIASLLLSGGRTAHSRFFIPINVNENSVCSIEPNSELADLINKTTLIIWDEAPMIHKHCFEALDRTMRDILRSTQPNSEHQVFGGKVILFGGDFRQILPVIPHGSRSNIVNASLNSSYIWQHCKVLKLTVNMRLRIGGDQTNVQEITEFADWILQLGEGLLGDSNDGEVDIQIPDNLLILDSVNPLSSLIEFTYPDIHNSLNDPLYFQQRAILAPTHDVVNEINERLLEMMPGSPIEYLSSDSLAECVDTTDADQALYSSDVLNNLRMSGLPNHKLVVKVGVPVMLLRNIDQPNGLCNGTRLQVIKLGKHVIEAKIITGTNIDHHTLISRLKMTPSDKRIPDKITRKQFHLSVCFAMTINKSQGQSLDRVGLYLPRPVFSHGQLYMAVSRVKTKKGLKILITDEDKKVTNNTTNVVYKEVLQNL
uniref:uncharacterized protein LOC122595729 n=1 Tax=Erigeron canadensis TaxID=72917 RepID=UPI001CB99021|nr:uncharacterized protein LOC122595729 [Erigeron canadensis]